MKTALKLKNISKTYIMGDHKPAQKAQKAIQKLHLRFESACSKGDEESVSKIETILKKAQELFAEEKYAESYEIVVGKSLKSRKEPRGVVVHALNGIDLEIAEGDLIAIMGPSGSGKSTLLNMLGLLDDASTGQIFIRDANITKIKSRNLPKIRSKELGFVFQSFNLIPTLTALENVMLPLRYSGLKKSLRKKQAQEALEKVGLNDRLHHTPNELSGGQRQRVAIARAIVNNPAIILGDELTGELDSKTTTEVMNLILELNKKGQTFVIVTHNPEVAKMCKKVIIMKDGKIVSA